MKRLLYILLVLCLSLTAKAQDNAVHVVDLPIPPFP